MSKKKTLNANISILKRIENKLEYLRLDSYSLSLFRIILGISVFYSLIFAKLPFATEIWGENPIIPIDIMKTLNGSNSFSIFDFIRNDSFITLYLWFSIIVALLYTIGFYTRYISVLLLFLFWNLLQANSTFSFGFDFYTFHILFWSMFLPLDNHFSVVKVPARKVSLAFSLAILFQIAFIYFATGMAKYGQSWIGGYAVRNMLLDIIKVKPMAHFFVDKAYLYKPFTYGSLLMEYLSPLFIFIKFRQSIFRYIFISFLLGFHFLIHMMYDVGNFSISGISVAFILLPSHFWTQVFKFPKDLNLLDNGRNKFITYFKYAFVVVFIYIISITNILFFTNYSALRGTSIANFISNNRDKITIPSPIKVSPFFQYWKMFAPNPTSKGGWLTLEYQSEKDGYYYDFFTDNLVTGTIQKPINSFKGMEHYLLSYSRSYIYKEEGYKFRIFLKYWIPYVVKRRGIDLESIKSTLYLADYAFEISDQSKPFTPEFQKLEIPYSKILKNDFGNLIE